jgi:hypothetical protein
MYEHSLADARVAVETLRAEGVDNFSLDLMSGLPNQVRSSVCVACVCVRVCVCVCFLRVCVFAYVC